MYLNGVILISAVVDFQTLSTAGGNELAYPLLVLSLSSDVLNRTQDGFRIVFEPADLLMDGQDLPIRSE